MRTMNVAMGWGLLAERYINEPSVVHSYNNCALMSADPRDTCYKDFLTRRAYYYITFASDN